MPAIHDQAALLDKFKEINFTGDDSMPVDCFYYSKNAGVTPIKMVPRGLKCRTCLLKDDSYDPVSITALGKRVYCIWEFPPNPDGTTRGLRCYYCVKWYMGRVRKSRTPPITLSEYERSLGESVASLQLHMTCVLNSILHIIKKGGNKEAWLDYRVIEQKSVKVSQKFSLVKEKPGHTHYERAYYELEFGGPLETNGNLAKGHRQWVLDNVDGVLVPDPPKTRIRMTEELATTLESTIASSKKGDSDEAFFFSSNRGLLDLIDLIDLID